MSVIKTFMVPRETHTRLNKVVSRLVYGAFMTATARVDDLKRRESILSVSAPSFLLCLLASWLVCLWLGFGLLLWPVTRDLKVAMRESGSSLFTLGFAIPRSVGANAIVRKPRLANLAPAI